MKDIRHTPRWITVISVVSLVFLCVGLASAQACYTGADLDAGARTSIQNAAQQYFGMMQSQNYAGLRSAAIPALSGSFGGIENAIGEHQKDLQGAQATASGIFLLDASNATGPIERAEFFCGIFNSPDRVSFVIPNLPGGKYAAALLTTSGGAHPLNVNFVLQQNGGTWQIAGLTMTAKEVGGHDLNWYLEQARRYHQQGANFTAFMYYWEAWNLAVPVPFEYTPQRDKIADEMQAAKPANFPTIETPLTLSANGKSYRITSLFPEAVGGDLDVIVKYQAVSDLSNTAAAFSDNTSVIKALLTQYPDLRNAFAGVVARAVAPNGSDYGTMLAMKDVK